MNFYIILLISLTIFAQIVLSKFKVLPYDRIDRLTGIPSRLSIPKIMNLDVEPLLRIRSQFKEIDVQKFKKAHSAILRKHIIIYPIIRALEHILTLSYDTRFNDEIRAWATFLREPVQRILVWNYIYELFSISFCTSIVSQNEKGKILHARNMDYPFRKEIPYVLYEAHYYKNEKFLYTSDGMIGIAGIISMNKPKAFTLSINSRKRHKPLRAAFQITTSQRPPTGWLIRMLAETASTFKEAYNTLKNEIFPARVYLTLGGVNPKEGVILQKNEIGIDAETWLTGNSSYIGITNVDIERVGKPKDIRREALLIFIKNFGVKYLLRKKTLLKMMRKFPIFNSYTAYTVLMSARTGEYLQYVYFQKHK